MSHCAIKPRETDACAGIPNHPSGSHIARLWYRTIKPIRITFIKLQFSSCSALLCSALLCSALLCSKDYPHVPTVYQLLFWILLRFLWSIFQNKKPNIAPSLPVSYRQNQTIDFFPANWYNNHRQPFLFSLGCQLLQNCQGCHG